MFPRYLTLDCNQLDQFCLSCSGGALVRRNGKNAGRVYIESLHLKAFMKDAETLNSEMNSRERPPKRDESTKHSQSPSMKRKEAGSPTKRKKSNGGEEVTDKHLLSQSFLGGLEGKRTWFLANSYKDGAGGGLASSHCQVLPSSTIHSADGSEGPDLLKSGVKKKSKKNANTVSPADDKFNGLLASEIKLAYLRKAMKLHDRLALLDNLIVSASGDLPSKEDGEMRQLECLSKPLPCHVQPVSTGDEVGSYFVAEGSKKVDNAQTPVSTVASADVPDSSTRSKPIDHTTTVPSPMNVDKVTSSAAISDSPHASLIPNATAKDVSSPFETFEAPPASPVAGGKVVNEKKPNISTYHSYDYIVREGKEASMAANLLLESFRRNRRQHWASKKGGDSAKCVWCPSGNCSGPSGDALIQCLECDLVGCGPKFLDDEGSSNQHIMLHFLISGHKFGEYKRMIEVRCAAKQMIVVCDTK
jgi:hypothetical protein